MMMELMGARETVAGPSQNGMMRTSVVSIGSVNPGITFATINHPNSVKAMNSIIRNMYNIGQS